MQRIGTVIIGDKEYVNPPELARARGVTAHTVRRYIREGELPAVNVLGRYLIPKDAADRWQPKPKGGVKPGAGRPRRTPATEEGKATT